MDEKYCYKLLDDNKDKFEKFAGMLSESNKKFNLTAICGEKDVFIKHFFDSVLPQELFFKDAEVIEIGSGGGFPSVPLMIVRGDLKFTLIESTAKKCVFLREVVEKLGLNCSQVLNARAEEAGRNEKLREKFDICCARAVAELRILAEYCLPFVKTGGKFFAYKGDCRDEAEAAENAVKLLGGEISGTYRYNLPEDCGKRTLIEITKIRETPEKYPRQNGQIKKKPL